MASRPRRRRTPRTPRVDPQDLARLLAVRSEMADLREDLLAARNQTESALEALKRGDPEAAERHLAEVQRAIEVAGKRTHLPEEIYYQRVLRSAAAKIFKGGMDVGPYGGPYGA